jgi:hypothetical protein
MLNWTLTDAEGQCKRYDVICQAMVSELLEFIECLE